MGESVTAEREKVEIVAARRVYTCWSWAERCKAPDEGWDGDPPCVRSIGVGEEHVKSTIYPGHESGYADGGWDARGNPIDPRPISSRFCMPCARRWTNLKRALDRLTPAAPATHPAGDEGTTT